MIRSLTPETQRLFEKVKVWPEDRLQIDLTVQDDFLLDFYSEGPRPPKMWLREFIQRFPEFNHIDRTFPYTSFRVAGTDVSALLIANNFPMEQIHFIDDEAKQYFMYLLLSAKRDEVNIDINAAYKAKGEVPTHNLETNDDLPLANYQHTALKLCNNSDGFGLFMEQGTGKTPVAIARACNLKIPEGRPARILVVCPNNVRMNWLSEFNKFSTKTFAAEVVRGGPVKRVKLLTKVLTNKSVDLRIAIVGYNTLPNCWDEILQHMPDWDLVIADEAHFFKSPKTKRYKYICKLRDKSDNRIALTGTPITNTPFDLYALFEFMGRGFSGFRSFKNFRKFYGVHVSGENGIEKLIALQNMPFLQERLARKTFSVLKKDALPDLPDKTYDVIEVEMSKDQEAVYKEVASHLMLEIEREMEEAEQKQMLINNVLVKLLRLTQITSGFISWDPVFDEEGNEIQAKQIEPFSINPKLEQLVEILQEKSPQDKTIIWATFVQDIKTIRDRLAEEGIDAVTFYGGTSDAGRAEAERRFNFDDDCKVFIGNAAAGGVGLNLLGYPPGDPDASECNANHVIYYSQDWSMVKRSQSEDRAHRRGTREPVRITDLCVPDTIDQEIRDRVVLKRRTAESISDVKSILEKVLSYD